MKTQNQHQIKPETQSCQMAVSGSVTASELRIGNLMHFPFTAENVNILGINAHQNSYSKLTHTISFEKGENLYCEKPSVLKPIPITEQWLIKFGFEKIIDNEFTLRYEFKKDPRFDYFFPKHNLKTFGLRFQGSTFFDVVKYVHQLQNFYFALTGRDLTDR